MNEREKPRRAQRRITIHARFPLVHPPHSLVTISRLPALLLADDEAYDGAKHRTDGAVSDGMITAVVRRRSARDE